MSTEQLLKAIDKIVRFTTKSVSNIREDIDIILNKYGLYDAESNLISLLDDGFFQQLRNLEDPLKLNNSDIIHSVFEVFFEKLITDDIFEKLVENHKPLTPYQNSVLDAVSNFLKSNNILHKSNITNYPSIVTMENISWFTDITSVADIVRDRKLKYDGSVYSELTVCDLDNENKTIFQTLKELKPFHCQSALEDALVHSELFSLAQPKHIPTLKNLVNKWNSFNNNEQITLILNLMRILPETEHAAFEDMVAFMSDGASINFKKTMSNLLQLSVLGADIFDSTTISTAIVNADIISSIPLPNMV